MKNIKFIPLRDRKGVASLKRMHCEIFRDWKNGETGDREGELWSAITHDGQTFDWCVES